MSNDIEKTNYDYYVAETTSETSSGCCQRLWNELVQHPFTLLEINGRVLDVQRTFANRPTWLVLPLKLVALGVALDTMVRELMLEYEDGDKTFYLAYFSHWALVLTIVYFMLSSLISLTCGTWATQPTAVQNRTSCVVTTAWTLYVLAMAFQGLNMLGYWILVHDYGDNTEWRDINSILTDVSYFTIMKNAGLCFVLLGEGQLLNRIPLRFAHLVVMEFGFCLYVGWTYLHSLTDLGNPDSGENQIYYFINWKDPQEIPNTAFGCAMTMLVVLPAMFLFLQLLSWPCRRYMPLVEPTANGDEEEGLYAAAQEGKEEASPQLLMDDVLEIPLPPGKIGLMLKHSPPQVYKMAPTSPLQGTGVQEGMVVDTLTLPDGTTFYNPMSAEELTGLLMDTSHETGRVMRFVSPQMSVLEEPPEEPEIPEELELELPSGSIGLVFHKTGPPPVLKSIKETSPLLQMYPDLLHAGMVVDTLTLEDGTTHYELHTKELTSLLKEHRHAEGRVMVLKRHDQPLTPNPPGDDGGDVYGGAAEEEEEYDHNMPEECLVELPPGPMMVMLEGMPPVVTKMAPESPLRDFGVVEGMALDTLELPNGQVYYEMATPDAKVKLAEHADSDGRVVRFINPDVLPLTKAPMTVREVVTTAPMMEAFEEVNEEEEEEVRENLIGMGFDTEAIDEAIDYYKSVGEPLDADTCMTRIITQ